MRISHKAASWSEKKGREHSYPANFHRVLSKLCEVAVFFLLRIATRNLERSPYWSPAINLVAPSVLIHRFSNCICQILLFSIRQEDKNHKRLRTIYKHIWEPKTNYFKQIRVPKNYRRDFFFKSRKNHFKKSYKVRWILEPIQEYRGFIIFASNLVSMKYSKSLHESVASFSLTRLANLKKKFDCTQFDLASLIFDWNEKLI